MSVKDKPLLHYSAKESYQDSSAAEEYERVRFSGLLGRYRYYREQKAVSRLMDTLPNDISIADCPCGTGRWWPVLARRARHIVAFDVSEGMLRYGLEQTKLVDIDIDILKGDAEHLPLADCSVDYAFSHALTKHLPIPVQYHVLAEFARIARFGVICSFGVFSHLTYELWRLRRNEESYPTFIEELEWMAAGANLKIRTMRKCTTPFGVEQSVLFDKLD